VGLPHAALFIVLACVFAGIAIAGAVASRWPIAIGSVALAVWMGSLAWSVLRKAR
jgi:hypothetical protein